MGGKTVITSKEISAVENAENLLKGSVFKREDKKTMILWKFPSEELAIDNAKDFKGCGFEYVQRV